MVRTTRNDRLRNGSPLVPLTRYELAVLRLMADQRTAMVADIRARCFPGRHAATCRRTLRQLVARTVLTEVGPAHGYRITEGGRELLDAIDGLIAEIAAPGSISGFEEWTDEDDPAVVLRGYVQETGRETGRRTGGFACRRWTRGVR
jgi:hypothetical protein